MAEQGKKIDEGTLKYLARLRELYGKTIRESAKEAHVSKSTAQKYLTGKGKR